MNNNKFIPVNFNNDLEFGSLYELMPRNFNQIDYFDGDYFKHPIYFIYLTKNEYYYKVLIGKKIVYLRYNHDFYIKKL